MRALEVGQDAAFEHLRCEGAGVAATQTATGSRLRISFLRMRRLRREWYEEVATPSRMACF